jgi:ankyrin repeat protein
MQARSGPSLTWRLALIAAAALPLALCGTTAHAQNLSPAERLFHAVDIDYAQGVSEMIAKGFDPNTRNAKGQPALVFALFNESLKAAQVLWEAPGIQVDAQDNAGETPLMMAALKNEEDAAAALIAHGASLNKTGWTPLHYAATGGSVPIVKLFIAKGAAIEARSPNNSTPLMMAAKYGSDEAVAALLAAGADRSAKNDLGMDAAAFATSAGRVKLAASLKAPATN